MVLFLGDRGDRGSPALDKLGGLGLYLLLPPRDLKIETVTVLDMTHCTITYKQAPVILSMRLLSANNSSL